MFNEPNLVGILKSCRISWAGHIWRAKQCMKLQDGNQTKNGRDSGGLTVLEKTSAPGNKRWRTIG